MVAKVWSRSHGQPVSGAGRRAMMASRRSSGRGSSGGADGMDLIGDRRLNGDVDGLLAAVAGVQPLADSGVRLGRNRRAEDDRAGSEAGDGRSAQAQQLQAE